MSKNVDELLTNTEWKPIPNSPGRFVQKPGLSYSSPEEIAQSETHGQVIPREQSDTVVVVPLSGGGLISYRKLDGSYRHTLNTEDGFQRKPQNLGIALNS